MKAVLFIFLGLALVSCEGKKAEKPEIDNTKITYSVAILQRENAPKLSPLQEALFKDKSYDRIVYVNGVQSCTKEVDDNFYFKGTATTIKNSRDTTAIYTRAFPYVTFWWPVSYIDFDALSTKEELFPVEVKFTNEQKTILGYRCKKATVLEERYFYTVWHTDELQLTDPTKALLRKDSIPGVILEMDETLNSEVVRFYTKYKAKTIEFKNKERDVYSVPKGAVELDPDRADVKNWKLMCEDTHKKEAANPYPESEKQKFEGDWILPVGKDNIKVSIKRKPGTGDYTVAEKYTYNGETEPFDIFPAKFYHNKLLVRHSPNYETYILTKDGKLKKESGDFYVFIKH